ncbi:MAG: hypothetical protein KY393_00320 [Actinobacteria bacterium]|nr:hypothetical protein [Actinomycetota bacterium]
MSSTTLRTAYKSESVSAERRGAITSLNRRIVLASCVVMAELWALGTALESWAAGQEAALGWVLGFQMVCFVLALSICWGAGAHPHQPMRKHWGAGGVPSPQPVAGD